MTGDRIICKRLALLGMCIILPACQESPSPNDLASDIPKLTRAIQAEAFYSGRQIPEDDLVAEVFAKKPELKTEFNRAKISVKAFRNAKEVVVLVHSPDGNHCWFEDGSWTHYVDRRCHELNPLPPAEFTLSPPAPESRPALSSRPATSTAP